MNKKEAIEVVKKKWGFLPYGGVLFSLYKDDDEIPQEILNYELNTNPYKQKDNYIICSPELANILNNLNNE